MGASLLVLTLAGIRGKMTSVKLVLAGMVINALCSVFSNFIIYFANNAEGIKTVTFWTMGSLAGFRMEQASTRGYRRAGGDSILPLTVAEFSRRCYWGMKQLLRWALI